MKTNVFNQSVTGGKYFIFMPLLVVVILAFTSIGTSYATDNPVDKSKLENQMKSVQFESVDIMPTVNTVELAKSIKYPEKARKMGLQGRVYVKVLVSKEGKPKDIEVSESTDEIFEQPAMDAIKEVTFSPAMKNGEAVNTWVTIPIDFKLK